MNYDLAVIVPTYSTDAPDWAFLQDLDEKLEHLGIKGQIVIVDDGSPHSIQKDQIPILQSSLVTLLKHESRFGANKSRNTGISKSLSELILLLDFGDFLSIELIESALITLKSETSIKLVGGTYSEIRKPFFIKREYLHNPNDSLFLGEVCPNGSGMAFYRTTWSLAGKFDESIFYGATDREFGLRVIDRFGRSSIKILPGRIEHTLDTNSISVFWRSFRMSKGYVDVLVKRRSMDSVSHLPPRNSLFFFNRKKVVSLVMSEGICFTLSNFLGKVLGRLLRAVEHRINIIKRKV